MKNPEASLNAKEEEQYTLYNETREQVLNSYNKSCEFYKYDLRQAAVEEVFTKSVILVKEFSNFTIILLFFYRKKPY